MTGSRSLPQSKARWEQSPVYVAWLSLHGCFCNSMMLWCCLMSWFWHAQETLSEDIEAHLDDAPPSPPPPTRDKMRLEKRISRLADKGSDECTSLGAHSCACGLLRICATSPRACFKLRRGSARCCSALPINC